MKKISKAEKARRLFAQGYGVNQVSKMVPMNYGHAWNTYKELEKKAAKRLEQQQEPEQEQPAPETKLTGGSNDYYKVSVTRPIDGGSGYAAECNDIIESLGMTFAEGNIMKALWRRAALRNGGGKPGSTSLYESEKIEFFAKRLVAFDRDYV